ncbi:hypothetical protein JCM5350_008339 [Sporobolomyces pararoseus]
MAQPRIVLRPPPHRDYLQGYPGIPASDPAKDPAPSQDPLFQLPHLLRPQAHLSGTVEIRSPAKGPQIRAKWLSLELEKIETVPPQNSSANGSSRSNGKDKNSSEGKFVELIGTGPSRLWIAGEDQGAPVATNANKKKGSSPFKKKGSNNDEDEDGFDFIPDANYPFKIPLPEGLPPSTDVDMKSSGISYQLVASLCVKGKKSILKTASKPTILLASASIILHKADILASFPAYSPVLSSPIPAKLPWIVPGGLTVGEAKESSLTIRRGFGGAEGSEGGLITLKVIRKCSAFGPGDPVPIFAEITWSGNTPIRLTRLDFVLREQITYRYPANNSAYLVRSPPRNNSIFTVNANVSAVSDTPTSFAVLYRDEPVSFELAGTVPTTHTRVTVRTAKHIDVAYHLKIRGMIEGGEEIVIDQWPVVIGNVNARVARGIVSDIGYVEGLCERGGLIEATQKANGNEIVQAPRFEDVTVQQPPSQRNLSTLAPPTNAPSPQVESPMTYSDSSTEKRRLLEARSNAANGSSFHISNPTHEQLLQSQQSTARISTPERPTPIRPQFAPSPTAEEEKRRYYEAATKSRDHLQGLRSEQTTPNHSRDTSSPISVDALRYRHASDGPSALSPTSSAALTDTPISPFVYQEASVVKLREDDDRLPANDHTISRSDTILAASGSAVSTTLNDERSQPPFTTQPSLLSPPSARSVGTSMLNRSLTSAESEKKRLFLEAKEMARIRQEEARLELERQNKVLEDFEFEEAQRDFEERLILEAEEERRKEEEKERVAFERRLELERLEKLAQFEREQREAQEKRQAETDKWARERKEEDEMKKRKAEELRRMDEEKEREETERRGALARKAAMERQRAEDEERRLAGERARREEAERRYRAEQLAIEEELRRRREEERRLQYEHDRRLQEEEHRRRVEQDRRDEEETHRIYLDRVRAEEEAAALAQRARSTSQQAYPSTYGRSSGPIVHPSIPPRRITPALDRAPSVASFAPSTSAANADSNFYAQAIASGQASALSQEKAEYLRQLRQGQHYSNGTPSSSPPTSQQQHQTHYRQEEYRSPPPSHPRQVSDTYSRDQQGPRSRSTTPTPTAQRPEPPSSSSSNTNGYKTAAEEKAEMAARRRVEEEQARNVLTSGSILNGGGGLDEEGDLLAPPPSYPVPGSSVNHGGSTTTTRSAAEEKEELSAYYRAKQAVETGQAQLEPQQEPPSPPPIRQAYPTSLSTSTSNGYQPSSSFSSSPSAPPPPPPNNYPYPVSSSSDGTSSQGGAHDRDPQVSLGKQRAESTNSTSSSSYPESILRNYSSSSSSFQQSPSAPPLPLHSRNMRYEDERGVGVEGFGSFHLETQFPEFERITGRMQDQ